MNENRSLLQILIEEKFKINLHLTRLMLPEINEAGVPVRFEGKSLFANYLNWLKQSHGSKMVIMMSYQKSAIRFYSKNGEFIIKCGITELDIVNIIINITIGNVKT